MVTYRQRRFSRTMIMLAGATVVCAVIFSRWYCLRMYTDREYFIVSLSHGCLSFCKWSITGSNRTSGFDIVPLGEDCGFHWSPRYNEQPSMLSVELPVWIPLVAIAGFAGISVWSRKTLVNPEIRYCKSCQYDLTGNAGGRCPECGQQIADPSVGSIKGTGQ